MHKDHMYVTDYFNHYVVVMSLTGEIVAKFGGEFLHEPEGITVDNDGFVYVTSHHSKIRQCFHLNVRVFKLVNYDEIHC